VGHTFLLAEVFGTNKNKFFLESQFMLEKRGDMSLAGGFICASLE
jgi:hypothetical protein